MKRSDPIAKDSIVALATPPGVAGVAIIRMSGRDALVRGAAVLGRKTPIPDRRAFVCSIHEPGSHEVIDQALVLAFRAPRSFTGENCLEIHCHGGPYIVQRVLRACMAAGFRCAEPGEFTRRAVLNGKMDLTEAEGLRELIEAQTEQEWRAGRQLSDGRLKNLVLDLRRRLLEALAYLEARIDFPDEGDTAGVSLEHVRVRVESVMTALQKLAATYNSGRVSAEGLRICLLGPPNAGKSSLLNALLGHERAIVSDIPGTTRDYIEEKCLVEGRLVRLVDMAGVRDTTDAIEQLGVTKALELASRADLILLANEAGKPVPPHAGITPEIRARSLQIWTKADLAPSFKPKAGECAVSSVTGEGIEALRKRLASEVDKHTVRLDQEPAWLTNARHADCVDTALGRLGKIMSQIAGTKGDQDELLAFELREAATALGLLVGEIYADDVLDVVFSSFCIGK
ncbi:MAG: tRNA uridine-5-carboxymethylaminomethyl(34) synthesis GTPase MnmE [Pseudomonadota bacterium]|jgi:tRNA modification GTPase